MSGIFGQTVRAHYNVGSKKVLSGCPGQVDFPTGQVTFHSHLPDEQGLRQVVC